MLPKTSATARRPPCVGEARAPPGPPQPSWALPALVMPGVPLTTDSSGRRSGPARSGREREGEAHQWRHEARPTSTYSRMLPSH